MPRICLVMKTRQQKERATACFAAKSITWWRGKWTGRPFYSVQWKVGKWRYKEQQERYIYF